MHRITTLIVCTFALSNVALVATCAFPAGAFESVSVASGVEVDISVGPVRSVTAETRGDTFDDLQIAVEGNVLRIERRARNWLSSLLSGGRPDYLVRVVSRRCARHCFVGQ